MEYLRSLFLPFILNFIPTSRMAPQENGVSYLDIWPIFASFHFLNFTFFASILQAWVNDIKSSLLELHNIKSTGRKMKNEEIRQ